MKEDEFDDIENRIREAMENNQPAYDEASWEKMNVLLGKEKKRRFPFWLFLVPLALGWGLYYYVNTGIILHQVPTVNHPALGAASTTSASVGKVEGDDFRNKSTLKVAQKGGSANADIIKAFPDEKQIANKKGEIAGNTANYFASRPQESVSGRNAKQTHTSNSLLVVKISSPVSETDTSSEKKSDFVENTGSTIVLKVAIPVTPKETNLIKLKESSTTVQKTAPEKTTSKQPGKKKTEKPRFYVVAMLGADNSNVKLLTFKNSTPSLQSGIGIGIDISGKLSIQTGLNVSHKKYVAGPGDYSPKTGTYLSMVDIRRVDANCLVYEIPLSIKYNVYHRKKLNVFASTGVSSYIMQRENYKYEYIRNNILNYTNWTYRDNRHLFSVLTLSAGAEKKINDKFSILATPVLSIPMTGVGDGKVKLYSTAFQVSVKYKPSKKAKKRN